MTVWIWGILLLVIGLVEYFIDQYQKITLSRLKFWHATLLQYINKILEFAVNVYVFSNIIDFWTKIKQGVYDFSSLFPYLAYFHGCIIGTALAIVVYKRMKRKNDMQRRLQHLEKARLRKKQYKNQLPDVSMEIEESILGDDLEQDDLQQQVVEQATEQIVKRVTKKIQKALESPDVEEETSERTSVHNQTDSNGTSSQTEERQPGTPPEIRESPPKT
jgi:hypothetical protein